MKLMLSPRIRKKFPLPEIDFFCIYLYSLQKLNILCVKLYVLAAILLLTTQSNFLWGANTSENNLKGKIKME